MALSDQEARCVELACAQLQKQFGGHWKVRNLLDEQYASEPSPEAIVSNGKQTAAIEVKRLTGDSLQQAHKESILSLERSLVPPCGGYFILFPPSGFQLPMGSNLMRYIKKEIGRVAPTLGDRQLGAIKIPRHGHVALAREQGPFFINCRHDGPYSELWQSLKSQIQGSFLLVDEGIEHSFITDSGREAFHAAVINACARRLTGITGTFEWLEEWRLEKVDGDEDGVYVMSVSAARYVSESVRECVETIVEKGLAKFLRRRWADTHMLVLEVSTYAPLQFVQGSMTNIDPTKLLAVDQVLLVDDGQVTQIYPSQGPTP
jgi:hypothetical protein